MTTKHVVVPGSSESMPSSGVIAPGAAADLSNLNAANLTSGIIPLARIAGLTDAQVAAGAAIAKTKLALAGTLTNADINAAAAIAYSKLALGASIVNADIAVGAAIAYAKLALAGAIVDADINAAAAIAWSKLSKAGSSLADLATRSAADLSTGLLPDARLPGYVSDGASRIQQLAFAASQSASADANTLDDYEEGTWTPSITPDAGAGITYGAQTGAYVKIGQLVFAIGRIQLTAIGTASGTATISGLPFTVFNSVGARSAVTLALFEGLSINVVYMGGRVVENTTTAFFSRLTAAAPNTLALSVAELSATGDVTFTIAYRAAA